jgi:ribosomal protein L7Ae-like RNA K-turn-binding protein
LQLLGIARKAGLLAIGGESVSAASRKGKVRAVFSASDASDGAKRRARNDSLFCGAEYSVVPYTKFELGNVTGRGSPGTLAILDEGLAAGFLRGLADKTK